MEKMEEYVYRILTLDFRTSLWHLNSDQEGSIFHICSYKKLPYEYNRITWDDAVAPFRQNFGVAQDERVIFVRDNTFFSSSHDQGLVITDRRIYYIEDNDYPEKRISFEWTSLKAVEYNEDIKSMIFTFKDESSLTIHMNYFSKGSETFAGWALGEIAGNLESLFTTIIDTIGSLSR